MSDAAASPLLFTSGFGRFVFTVACNNQYGFDLADFLFADLPGCASEAHRKGYDIVCSGSRRKLSLWEGDKRLYFGDCAYQLAYVLMNEVLYHCIDSNQTHHALHAGGVSGNGRCILLPGESGSGKSSLTAWLTSSGYRYLTDELVFLSDDGVVTPLTRPISLKGDDAFLSRFVADGLIDRVIVGDSGAIVPHRLLNPDYQAQRPQLSHIFFPTFKAGAPLSVEEISPARSCLYLMRSHVNARNLEGLGVAALSRIARSCRSYTLHYGGFDQLESMFGPDSGLFR